MGGAGSGRWHRFDTKDTTSGNCALDVRYLQKRGLLRPGIWYAYSWTRGGDPAGDIRVTVGDGMVVLNYRSRRRGSPWQDVSEPVLLTTTPCHFGGSRPWFVCPRCLRRVALLYGAGTYFWCRRCHRLAYPSQNERGFDRALTIAQGIRRKLGGSASLCDFFPLKPPGMHWRAYRRLRERAERAESWAWDETAAFLARLERKQRR